MQRTAYSHAILLLTSLVSKPHFLPSPENAVWKRDSVVSRSTRLLQVEVLVLVDRMSAEDSVATL